MNQADSNNRHYLHAVMVCADRVTALKKSGATCSDFESSNNFDYSDSILVQLEFRTLHQQSNTGVL